MATRRSPRSEQVGSRQVESNSRAPKTSGAVASVINSSFKLALIIISICCCQLMWLDQLCDAKFQHEPMHLMAAPAPPPQIGTSFVQLARSPASSALASEFFAAERKRTSAALGAPVVGARSASQFPLANLSIASQNAVFSQTLDGALRLDQYHTLEEIYAYLEALARRYKHVQVFTIGRTSENRPIKALELTNNSTDPDFVWLDALTHAREWITGSTLLYTLDRLVAGPTGSDLASAEAGNRIFSKNYLIIPVVNPDGYAYTWSTNRMWRKNRSKSAAAAAARAPDSRCVGADLNRNFDHSFGGEGASSDPCSHIYSGPFAFSEPETRALAEMMWSLKERIKFYLTMHSFNQLWACPYAHTTEQSAHLAAHLRVLRSIQRAVRQAEGQTYQIGPLSTSLYIGSGFGIDFAYDKCAIVHSYLVELRDQGANGFVLPPDQIMPTARETFAGLRAGLRSVFGP